jgi:hypothetical protein
VSSPEDDSRLFGVNEKDLVHISDISGCNAPSVSTRCGGTVYLTYKLLVSQILVGKPEGKNHFGDPGVDGRIILRWIFRKWYVGLWTGSSWLMIGTGGGQL